MKGETPAHTANAVDEVLTARVAAKEKGVHPVSIYRAVKEGRLKGSRSGNTILIRRRDLDEWQVVGHRPPGVRARTPPSGGLVIPSPEERSARAEQAIRLLDEWMADESGYDEETWPLIKEALDRDRLSSRKLFPGGE